MDPNVLHRLPADLAAQLSAEEREELARRLAVQDARAAQLQALPLEVEEPALPTPEATA